MRLRDPVCSFLQSLREFEIFGGGDKCKKWKSSVKREDDGIKAEKWYDDLVEKIRKQVNKKVKEWLVSCFAAPFMNAFMSCAHVHRFHACRRIVEKEAPARYS